MSHRLRTALAVALAAALAVVAGPAAALGLGQIHVKSRPGQPLLAEIPIVTSDPAELQGLQVRLASPETFRRIGLEPPHGDVSALHFEPALDAQGRPVIRITSPAPVQQPLLTFLVEVDWSGGKLVREYSALVETPRTVAAPAQPPIEAPVVAPPNTIQAPAVTSEPLPPPAAAATSAPPAAAQPAPAPTAAPPVPASPPPPAPAPATPVAATPVPPPAAVEDRYEVRRGDTLYRIAAGLRAERGDGLDQAMIALLRANPRAFIGGNINRLKAGAVLRMPSAEQVASLDAAQAAAIVHEQIAGWRAERRALQQPVAAATTGEQAKAGRGARTASADARLEIVPPSGEGGRQAGSRSGVDAGGEGEMLRQQLQETKETLAARDAEVNELKARVAELEKIRHDQQQLIEMKDSALAAAQQNLHKATATQPAGQAQPAQPQPGQTGGLLLWGGVVLVIAAFVGWLLARRRRPAAAPTASRRFDTAALAASIPTSAPQATASRPESETHSEPEPEQVAPEVAPLAAARAAQAAATPSWHAGQAADAPAPAAESVASGAPKRPPEEQLDLAQAYLDVGDEEAARTLLREVLDGRDPAARATAARMLRDL